MPVARVAPDDITTPGVAEKYEMQPSSPGGPGSAQALDSGSFFRDGFTPKGFISANSDFQEKWDLILLVLMGYVMTVTPYEVCFLDSVSIYEMLFWVNRLVDAFFLGDMVCQFYLIPQDFDLQTTDVKNLHWTLGINYLKGWFTIDFLSIFPYDFLTWYIEQTIENADVSILRLMRIIRLTRLAKILRVLRASRIIARYDDNVGISFVKFRITKYCLLIICSVHWFACMLRLVTLIEGDETNNWIMAYYGTMDVPPGEVYNTAIYWSMVTFTSVGYGDLLPQTQAEILMTTLVILMSACLFAFLLGSVTSLVASLDVQEQEYFGLRDALNEFTKSENLPKELCYKLRKYLRSRYQQGALFDWSIVLEKLSTQLKEEVASCMQSQWLRGNVYFKDASHEHLAAVAGSIKQGSYVKGESLIALLDKPETMFVIRQGRVMSEGQLLGPGKLVGEDMLYFAVHEAHELQMAQQKAQVHEHNQPELSSYEAASLEIKQKEKVFKRKAYPEMRDYRSVAVCFTVANMISKEELMMIFASHPDLLAHVKQQVTRLIFRTHIMAYAKAYDRQYNVSPALLSMNVDSGLVDWYHEKLASLHNFASRESNLTKITKLQKFMRGYLGKVRFRKVCRLLSSDPKVLHRRIMSTLREGFDSIPKNTYQDFLNVVNKGGVGEARALTGMNHHAAITHTSDHSAERRIELNESTIKHCTDQIAMLKDQIAMFENTMKIASQDLVVAQAEVEVNSEPSHDRRSSTNLPPIGFESRGIVEETKLEEL